MKRILLFIDDPYLLKLVRYFIVSRIPDCEIVHAAGPDHFKQDPTLDVPDLIVLSTRSEAMRTTALLTATRGTWPETPIIVYGNSHDLRLAGTTQIPHDDRILINFNAALHATLRTKNTRTILDELSPTDHRILALITTGATNKQIANALSLQLTTVNLAILSMFTKFGVRRSRSALATIYTLNSAL